MSEQSLTERAYEALTQRLILLDIAPGDAINEAALSGELGIGRTPMREALKRLESDHLVISYPRRGTFASPVDITALSEISEIRRALEPLAARRAAEHLSPAMRDEIVAVRASLGQEHDPRASMAADLDVHRALYEACGSAHLRAALVRYGNLATRIWSVAIDRLADTQAHVDDHVAILDAVLAGHADEAAELMLAHMRDFEDRIRAVL